MRVSVHSYYSDDIKIFDDVKDVRYEFKETILVLKNGEEIGFENQLYHVFKDN